MRRKNLLALCLSAVALSAALSGCSRTPTAVLPASLPTVAPTAFVAPAQAVGGVSAYSSSAELRVAYVAAEGSSYHPLRTNVRDMGSINSLAFESVVELDDNLQPVPLLADRWTLDDGLWTFTLRSGIVFHDGSPLTAYDVVESYNAIIAHGSSGAYYDRVRRIGSMVAEDELTITVTSNDVDYLLLYAMTFPVVQRYSIDAQYQRGTGPYWYISSVGSDIRLERNPFWWKKQPYIQAIVAINYETIGEAMQGYELGEVDVVFSRSPSVAYNRYLSNRMTIDYTTTVWECIIPNLSGKIVGDLAVRRALMYAIDRTTLAGTVYLGMTQESETPVIPASWLYEAQSTIYDYSPERALKILRDAGWDDTNGDGTLDRIRDGLWQDLEINIITYNEPSVGIRDDAAQLMAEQLARVGVKLNVTTTTKAKVRTALRDGDFDLALAAFNLSALPDLTFMLGTDGEGNYSGYASATMDSYLKAVKNAQTAEELKSAMSSVQMTVVNDLPVMGLFFRSGALISSVGINGLSGGREGQTLRGLEFWNIAD